MELLVCPICKGDLRLIIGEENEGEVISGELYCQKCPKSYLIKEKIPNLLPPQRVQGS